MDMNVAYVARFRMHRVRGNMARAVCALSQREFDRFVLEHQLGEERLPQLTMPPYFEAAKSDGWCLLAVGGAKFDVLDGPFNMRDDHTGQRRGEIAMLEGRHGNLWGLAIFCRHGEDEDTFAARVRMARIMRDVVPMFTGEVTEDA